MIKYNNELYSGFYEKAITQKVNIDDLVEKNTLFDRSYLIPPSVAGEECPYEEDTGIIFLKGSCNIFAAALKDVYGYNVYEVSYEASNHWYCLTIFDGKEVYVDVRRATSDFLFFSGRYSFIRNKTSPQPVLRTDLRFEDESWRDTGYIYALGIIDTNEGFYGNFRYGE